MSAPLTTSATRAVESTRSKLGDEDEGDGEVGEDAGLSMEPERERSPLRSVSTMEPRRGRPGGDAAATRGGVEPEGEAIKQKLL